eukprot:15375885-Heterocapsa_arctica.AAC.1
METPPLKRLAFEAKDEVFFQGMLGRVRSYDGDPRPYHATDYAHHLKYKATAEGNLERQVGAVQAAHNMACEGGDAYFEDMPDVNDIKSQLNDNTKVQPT